MRLVSYTQYCSSFAGNGKPKDIFDYFPLPFDPTPEQRKKDAEEQLRREQEQGLETLKRHGLI